MSDVSVNGASKHNLPELVNTGGNKSAKKELPYYVGSDEGKAVPIPNAPVDGQKGGVVPLPQPKEEAPGSIIPMPFPNDGSGKLPDFPLPNDGSIFNPNDLKEYSRDAQIDKLFGEYADDIKIIQDINEAVQNGETLDGTGYKEDSETGNLLYDIDGDGKYDYEMAKKEPGIVTDSEGMIQDIVGDKEYEVWKLGDDDSSRDDDVHVYDKKVTSNSLGQKTSIDVDLDGKTDAVFYDEIQKEL